MESYDIDKLKHISNTEVIRRLLIKYFIDKGFNESFDRQLYPSIVQDLPLAIPALSSKVEVIPHAVDVDNLSNRAVIGWNLFVLGNHRMYLGETVHNDLAGLATQINSGIFTVNESCVAKKQTTPRRVIHFLTRILGNLESGFVDLRPTIGNAPQGNNILAGQQSNFFTRSGYGT